MKHIKYDRRSRLTTRHLDDMMRIRINGVDDIAKFSAGRYAKAWLDAGHTDTAAPAYKRKNPADSTVIDDDEDEDDVEVEGDGEEETIRLLTGRKPRPYFKKSSIF